MMPVIKCPDCGAFNGSDRQVCKKCGGALSPKSLDRAAGAHGEEGPNKVDPWYKRLLRRNK